MERIMNKCSVKPHSIDVMVGLPHLAVGALLRRARELQQPVLVSANALSRWSRKRGWREWAGWTTRPLANARSLHSLRSEEHTSELQSLMRISYAVFCLKKKKHKNKKT